MRESISNYYRINILPAIKNAKTNARRSLTFVLAIVLMQFLLCTISLSMAQNRVIESKEISKVYDAHMIIYDVPMEDKNFFHQAASKIIYKSFDGTVIGETEGFEKLLENKAGIVCTMVEITNNYGSTVTYDYYITFQNGNLRDNYYQFMRQFNDIGGRYEVTPKLYSDEPYGFSTFFKFFTTHITDSWIGNTAEDSAKMVNTIFGTQTKLAKIPIFGIDSITIHSNSFIFFILNIITVIISALILMALYSERVNHYKFDFGIYSAFGADTKKLIKMSMWEIMIIDIIILIPAALISILTLSAIYGAFVFFPTKILSNWLLSLIIVFIAVYYPIKALKKQNPVQRLSAADNSNYIKSPRNSAEIFGKSIPRKTSNITMLRFRKYYVKTIAITAAFASLFYAGSYCATIYNLNTTSSKAQFEVNFNSAISDYEQFKSFENSALNIDGVKSLETGRMQNALQIRSFAAVKNVSGSSFIKIPDGNFSGYYATSSFHYIPGDDATLKSFEGKNITGDVNVYGNNLVIIEGEGTKLFNISVGDIIYIAELANVKKSAPTENIDGLAAFIRNYDYIYTEYKVSAIISDSTYSGTALCINDDNYTQMLSKTELSTINSYVKLSPDLLFDSDIIRENGLGTDEFYVYEGYAPTGLIIPNTAYYASYDFSLMGYNNALIEMLKNYDVTGNLSSQVLTRGNAIIIIPEYVDKSFNLKINDNITIARPSEDVNINIPEGLEKKEWLNEIISQSKANVVGINGQNIDVKIAAIVRVPIEELEKFGLASDIHSGAVILNTAEYVNTISKALGSEPSLLYRTTQVFIDDDLTVDKINYIFYSLRAIRNELSLDFDIIDTRASFSDSLRTQGRYSALIVVISVGLLFASFVILFFAQKLFYLRRNNEFFILRTLGAKLSDIRKTLIYEGLLISLFIIIFYTVFAFLTAYIVYLITRLSGNKIEFSPPLIQFLIGLAVGVISGIISTVLPYFSYNKNSKL